MEALTEPARSNLTLERPFGRRRPLNRALSGQGHREAEAAEGGGAGGVCECVRASRGTPHTRIMHVARPSQIARSRSALAAARTASRTHSPRQPLPPRGVAGVAGALGIGKGCLQ